eukprot:gene18146-21698_t
MFDGTEETCWNSHQGSPQSCSIQFIDTATGQETPVDVSELHICFQGGFVGKDCELLAMQGDSKEFTFVSMFYPEDINTVQIFPVAQCTQAKQIKLLFKQSTDFFGRITIYKLDVQGTRP